MNDGYSYTKTNEIIKNIIDITHPDLFVITGDTVDPARYSYFEQDYKDAMSTIVDSGIPWMWTGGSNVDGMSRDQVLGVD